ncbi:response regulator [Taibaiella koreensis]|uniref:response regulator n=1 Tax=Taibaiella koreensis TaxID=1268548 RepID=UPI000E59B662|nr:response regulator transcription factor [Taibaiella koreensis]
MEIKIMIVDDHPMIIDGLKNMLRGYRHIRLIGAFNDGASLMADLPLQQPDVLLLDIQLPGTPGDELVPLILQQYPGIAVLALTNFNSTLYVNTMLRQGAKGYLLKTTRQPTLIHAIETVSQGGTYIEPALQDKLQQEQPQRHKHIYARLSLTIREKEILRLLAAGKSNQEIADSLFLGYNTVRNYRARIFTKLEVGSIGELVKKALTLGLGE